MSDFGPGSGDQIAVAHKATYGENVVLDTTRRADERARAILSGGVACPDCASSIERTMHGDTFVLVVLHSATCPTFAQLWCAVQDMETHRQVDEYTREVIVS